LAKLFQRRRFFRNRPTGQELPMVAVFVNGWSLNEQFLIDASYQVRFGSFGQAVSETIFF
jgi:hypothetical protein